MLNSRACFSCWYWGSRHCRACPWEVASGLVGSWSLWMMINATELLWGRVTCWHRTTWSLGLQHLWMGLLRLLWKSEAQKRASLLSWQAANWRWPHLDSHFSLFLPLFQEIGITMVVDKRDNWKGTAWSLAVKCLHPGGCQWGEQSRRPWLDCSVHELTGHVKSSGKNSVGWVKSVSPG